MTDAIAPELAAPLPPGLHPARVNAVEGPCSVRLDDGRGAQIAVPGYEASAGDEVLVCPASDDTLYVLGVVRALRPSVDPELIEWRAGDSRVRISATEGIVLESAQPIRASAPTVGLTAGEAAATVSEDGVRIDAETFAARVAKHRVEAHTVETQAHTVVTAAHRVLEHFDSMERKVRRMVERAESSYREVTGLAQTRAERVRLLARGTLQAVGERALLKARGDVKLKGEQIHLG